MDLSAFKHIHLDEIEQVKLLNRRDTKYYFHIIYLKQLLGLIADDYYILTINDKQLLSYSTTYYDTTSNSLFLNHVQGRLNRIKLRQRHYIDSDLFFLELKQKNNKGRTIKTRISSDRPFKSNDGVFTHFIKCNTKLPTQAVVNTLDNSFKRITLINKGMTERCTIDLNLGFKSNGENIQLPELAIAEIKSDGYPRHSALVKALHQLRIKSSGFSKYCIGLSLLNPQLKSHTLKPKLRRLHKTIQAI